MCWFSGNWTSPLVGPENRWLGRRWHHRLLSGVCQVLALGVDVWFGSRRFAGSVSRRSFGRVLAFAPSLPSCFRGRLAAGQEGFASPGPASRPPRKDGVASALRGPAADSFESVSLSRIPWVLSYHDVTHLHSEVGLRRRFVGPLGRPGAWPPGRRRSARPVLRFADVPFDEESAETVHNPAQIVERPLDNADPLDDSPIADAGPFAPADGAAGSVSSRNR